MRSVEVHRILWEKCFLLRNTERTIFWKPWSKVDAPCHWGIIKLSSYYYNGNMIIEFYSLLNLYFSPMYPTMVSLQLPCMFAPGEAHCYHASSLNDPSTHSNSLTSDLSCVTRNQHQTLYSVTIHAITHQSKSSIGWVWAQLQPVSLWILHHTSHPLPLLSSFLGSVLFFISHISRPAGPPETPAVSEVIYLSHQMPFSLLLVPGEFP